MSRLLQELEIWGCDVRGAMERLLEDEELYRSCLESVAEDKGLVELGEALKEGKTEEAFDYAHMLKGVIANMGLTPMLEIVVRIVETLRAGSCDELLPVYGELIRANDHLKELLEKK